MPSSCMRSPDLWNGDFGSIVLECWDLILRFSYRRLQQKRLPKVLNLIRTQTFLVLLERRTLKRGVPYLAHTFDSSLERLHVLDGLAFFPVQEFDIFYFPFAFYNNHPCLVRVNDNPDAFDERMRTRETQTIDVTLYANCRQTNFIQQNVFCSLRAEKSRQQLKERPRGVRRML